MADTREAYPYVCLECGQKVNGNERYFLLHPLLACMYLEMDGKQVNVGEALQKSFEVGGIFGGPVLGVEEIKSFLWQSAEAPPIDMLTKIGYSMINVVRMIEMQLHLPENNLMLLIRYMVKHDEKKTGYERDFKTLVRELEWRRETDKKYVPYLKVAQRVQTAATPFLKQGTLGNREEREAVYYTFLDTLKKFCMADPAVQFMGSNGTMFEVDCTRIRKLYVGWIYTVSGLSGRKSPEKLYICTDPNGTNGGFECTESCCPHCHSRLSKVYGVYRQVTIGLLGGQSIGKTTFLAAFTDFVDTEVSTGAYRKLPFTLGYERPEEDRQWRKFLGIEESRNRISSPKWAYRHGFHVQKTDLGKDSAASLTFVVTPKDKEPVIYALADVAGEAFGNQSHVSAAAAAAASKSLLRHCDALFMGMSCDPEDLQVEAARYKEWMMDFPDKNIPAALLLTKAEMVFPGGNCVQYGGAVNLRRIQPVVEADTADGMRHAVYNLEAMSSLCRVAGECAETIAPGILANLTAMMREKGSLQAAGENIRLAVFPVSAGTAGYCDYYADEAQGERKESEGKKRYEKAKAERFGIAAPFLWLLALDGILSCGRGQDGLPGGENAQNRLAVLWGKELRCPQEE